MWIVTSPIVARAFGEVFYGARRRRNLEPATVAQRGRLGLDELNDIERGQVEPSLTLLMRSGLGLGVSPVCDSIRDSKAHSAKSLPGTREDDDAADGDDEEGGAT